VGKALARFTWLLLALAPAAATAQVFPIIEASRGTLPGDVEVAPLAVFFDGMESGWTGHGREEIWQDLEFRWDFGDPGAGSWSRGNQEGDAHQRNLALGSHAAHVFEQPGTYVVTLTLTDPATGQTAQTTKTIYVDDPDVVYAGSKTVCFSNDTDFTGCPTGATQVAGNSNWETLALHIAPERRLLLKRGDTWSSGATVYLASAGPGTIGAFGSGPDPAVSLGATLLAFDGGSDWRIMDLDATGTAAAAVFTYSSDVTSPVFRLLFLRVDAAGGGFRSAFEFGVDLLDFGNLFLAGNNQLMNELFVVDGVYATSNNVAFVSSRRLALLGNRWGPGGAHGTRIEWADRAVVQHNDYEDLPFGFEGIKWHGASNFTDVGGGESIIFPERLAYHLYSQEGIVSDNDFDGAGLFGVSIAAQNNISDERLRRFLVERNFVKMDADSQIGIQLGASDSVLRNNVVTGGSDTFGYNHVIVGAQQSQGLKATNVKAYNNTCFAQAPAANIVCVRFETTSVSGSAGNNLLYAPGASGESDAFSDRTPGGGTRAGCNFQVTANPFVSATPIQASDFQLAPGSAPVDVGCPVRANSMDYGTASRPVDGDTSGNAEIDIGAFEKP
jgi:PKD repeat protein